jgi:hypothetical protein
MILVNTDAQASTMFGACSFTRPILLDRGSAINLVDSATTGSMKKAAVINGFVDETSKA